MLTNADPCWRILTHAGRYAAPIDGQYALQRLGNCMNSAYLGGENQASVPHTLP